MSELARHLTNLPPEQEAIRAKCFHPTGTFVEFPREEIEQSIPQRFEKIVRMYPDRIAVKTNTHEFTYDTLNRAANRIGHAILVRHGEGEEPIALLLENDGPMIAAILGALKAGKIYVPLDPSYPYARTAYMLEDSQAGLIVTNDRNLPLAKQLAGHGCQLMNVDELECGLSTKNLGLSVSPDSLAYIIYTSGSTGQPKGVVQNHRNMLHFIMYYTNSLHICAADRLILLYSPCVIGGPRNTFSALLNGAAIFPFDVKQEGLTNLASRLAQEGITFYHSVASLFRHFTTLLTGKEKFPKLRLVRIGGETIYQTDIELYKKHFSLDSVMHVCLASSEAGAVAQYFIDRETNVASHTVPVGYPVDDTEILLLDDDGHEVGVNRIGEIVVKSRYLSPGYWQRLDLTQAAFLPHPNGSDERIYRTGDLGLRQVDGCLIPVGRKDFQVKVRGYRIEIAEIEAALLGLSAIKEAVVVPQEDRHGDQRLLAYLVLNKQFAPSVTRLRRVLAEVLPDYMIPSAFVFLDALPLTPNGKLDRKALPDPGKSRPELDVPFEAPRTSVEEELAQIWREVLSLEQLGVHDNFLALGGHSLAATRVISQVIKKFQLELPLQSLFQSPTVAEMAAVITEHQGRKIGEEELDRVLTELESLSEAEATRILSDQSGTTNTRDSNE
jgi:amino acid adenylation domain-containing protein